MGVQTTQGYRGKLVDKLTGTILDQFSDENIKVSNNILDLFAKNFFGLFLSYNIIKNN